MKTISSFFFFETGIKENDYEPVVHVGNYTIGYETLFHVYLHAVYM